MNLALVITVAGAGGADDLFVGIDLLRVIDGHQGQRFRTVKEMPQMQSRKASLGLPLSMFEP